MLSLVGIVVILGIAFLCSNNRKKIRWKIVWIGLLAEFVFAFLILHTAPGRAFFGFISRVIIKVLSFAYNGIDFVFGWLYSGQGIQDFHARHAFVLEALVPIVFFGSLISILYHYRIMQKVVKLFASIAIQIGGIGEIAPGRRKDVARLGIKAVLAAVLANILSAAIAGVMFF